MRYLLLLIFFSLDTYAFSLFDNSNCKTISYKFYGNHLVIRNWDIAKGNYECLFEKLKPFNAITIVKGNGGELFEAHKIADRIKKDSIKVSVSYSCVSACTFMIAATPKFKMCKNTQIGIHHYGSKGVTSHNNSVSKFHYEKMKEYGINIKNYKKVFENTPHEKMHDLNMRELNEMGFHPKISKSCKKGE